MLACKWNKCFPDLFVHLICINLVHATLFTYNLFRADASSDTSGASDHHGHVTTPPVATRRDTAHKTSAEPSRSVARALFDYTGGTDEDLSFKCGQEIVVLEWINSDWVKGRLAGRTGIFPANFVEIVEG